MAEIMDQLKLFWKLILLSAMFSADQLRRRLTDHYEKITGRRNITVEDMGFTVLVCALELDGAGAGRRPD